MEQFEYKKLDVKILTPDENCTNTDNCFYKKKIVFTGDLQGWDRQTAASLLQILGADINTSISSKTNIVIVGQNAGPSKLSKIIDLLAEGYNIRLMNEKIFVNEIKPYLHLLNIS